MKKVNSLSIILFALTAIIFSSCSDDADISDTAIESSESKLAEITAQLESAGFSTEGLMQTETNGKSGFLVEGDIFLTADEIKEIASDFSKSSIDKTQTEHYVTNNRVSAPGGRRVINIFLDPNYRANAIAAFNLALRRYNNQNLTLTFQRTNNRASSDIEILLGRFPRPIGGGTILGQSAGFPRFGDPAKTITLNVDVFGGTNVPASTATVFAHEIGHAIGFRHTDLFDRSFSCGGQAVNEESPASGFGAIFVPGTPQGPERGSFMLACSDGTDRPFTRNDRRALRRVY